jgi:Glycosyl transferase family 11
MVIVSLRGGLGNQMFQYAAGLNLSLKNKTPLVLDTTFLNDRFPRAEFTYRTFDLDVFNLVPPVEFTKLSELSSAFPIPGIWLGLSLLWAKVSRGFGHKNDIFLWGRSQSQNYFAENQDAVRAAFQFKFPLEGEAAKLARDVAGTNSVLLHVRRGDYVAFKNMKKIMGETDIVYYRRAVDYLAERVKDPTFYIFSDDITWCRENIKIPFATVYVGDDSAGPKNSFHLQIMSLCNHAIIANSTFSWWGAWLNRNPRKIVVAPRSWQVQIANDSWEDIIPAGWVAL